MPKDIRNVFVSHIHEDDAGLADLNDLLGRHDMEVRNYSISKRCADPTFLLVSQ